MVASLCLLAPFARAQTPADAHWDGRFGYAGGVGEVAVRDDRVIALGLFPCIGEDDPEEVGPAGYYDCALAIWDASGWRFTGPLMRHVSSPSRLSVGVQGEAYVAGPVTTTDGHTISGVATWTGVEWFPVGAEFNGSIYTMRIHDTGMFVGGGFTEVGDELVNHVAFYGSSGWSALVQDQEARGVNGAVTAITSTVDRVHLGGHFTIAGNVQGVGCIATWGFNQNEFSRLGTGLPCNPGTSLVPDKLVLAGGGLYALLATGDLYRLDGDAWVEVLPPGPNLPNGFRDIHVALNGLVYGVGSGSSGGDYMVWDGISWNPVGPGARSWGFGGWFVAGGSVDVYANVQFLLDGRNLHGLGRWDGSEWSPVGMGLGQFDNPAGSIPVRAFAEAGGSLFAAGDFLFAGAEPAQGIARWDGTRWVPLQDAPLNAFRPDVRALLADGSGLIVGGHIPPLDGVLYNGIARWDGASWHPLGSGLTGIVPEAPGTVQALLRVGSDVYVVGSFWNAGGSPASQIARWDGTAWHAVGSGLGSSVMTLALHEGRIYAGGSFNQLGDASPARGVAMWDGERWTAVGSIGPDATGTVLALASYRGQLYATYHPHGLYRWTDEAWEEVAQFTRSQGHGLTPAKSAPSTLLVNGNDLYVGGDFTRVDEQRAWGIAKFDGTTWSALGSGLWSADLFGGVGSAQVYALGGSSEGLWIGGLFTRAGNAPAHNVALWRDFSHVPTSTDSETLLPEAFALHQNYPNPFNPSTTIIYDVVESAHVVLEIHDVLGRHVLTLVDSHHRPGRYERVFDASHLPSGLYFSTIRMKDFVAVKKMVLIK